MNGKRALPVIRRRELECLVMFFRGDSSRVFAEGIRWKSRMERHPLFTVKLVLEIVAS